MHSGKYISIGARLAMDMAEGVQSKFVTELFNGSVFQEYYDDKDATERDYLALKIDINGLYEVRYSQYNRKLATEYYVDEKIRTAINNSY